MSAANPASISTASTSRSWRRSLSISGSSAGQSKAMDWAWVIHACTAASSPSVGVGSSSCRLERSCPTSGSHSASPWSTTASAAGTESRHRSHTSVQAVSLGRSSSVPQAAAATIVARRRSRRRLTADDRARARASRWARRLVHRSRAPRTITGVTLRRVAPTILCSVPWALHEHGDVPVFELGDDLAERLGTGRCPFVPGSAKEPEADGAWAALCTGPRMSALLVDGHAQDRRRPDDPDPARSQIQGVPPAWRVARFGMCGPRPSLSVAIRRAKRNPLHVERPAPPATRAGAEQLGLRATPRPLEDAPAPDGCRSALVLPSPASTVLSMAADGARRCCCVNQRQATRRKACQ